MKKCLGFFILTVCLFFSTSYASVDSIYEAAIIELSGNVQVDVKGNDVWIPAWKGLRLMEGAVLRTGEGASVDMVFDPEGLNLFRVFENSRIMVDKDLVYLPNGSVLARFGNLGPGESFEVRTPLAVSAIRGSGMGVDSLQDLTILKVFEDRAFVQGIGPAGNIVGLEVTVPEGWKVHIRPGGEIDPPEKLTENELIVFKEYREQMMWGRDHTAGESLPWGMDEKVDGKDLDQQKDGGLRDISPSS